MSELTKEEKLRYSRQIRVPEIGISGQEKIKAARVLVIGAGGLGCPLLQYLCSAGIGTIGIVDFDKVEIHNLHRQILYTGADIGKNKARVASEKLSINNPTTQFIVFEERLNKQNASDIIQQFDIIVDGCDNFPTRYLINDSCTILNKPLIYGSILGFEGQLAVFNYKGSKNLRDLFPEPPHPKDIPGCDENGVLATLPGIIGVLMAHETLKLITGNPVLTNQFILFDTLVGTFSTFNY